MSRCFVLPVVTMLLSIILSLRATDVLQCIGRRLDDGLISFEYASYEVKENMRDCETQWLVDKNVVGHSDDSGDLKFKPPIVNASANTAIFQTCPEKLERLLICTTSNINEMQQCSCDATPTTTLPEVGFPNWSIGVLIGASAFAVSVLVTVTVIIVVCRKRLCQRYSSGRPGLPL